MSNRLLLMAALASAYAAPQSFEVAPVKLVTGAPPHAVSFNLNHERVTSRGPQEVITIVSAAKPEGN